MRAHRMRKRAGWIPALLLALTLLCPRGLAAARPALVCETWEDGTVLLTLEDLDGSGVYGAQVELTLDGEYPGCSFTPDASGAYSPDCTVEVRRGKTLVTVYITDNAPLNGENADILVLGELDLDAAEDGSAVLPDRAQITLLDRGLEVMGGAMGGAVPVEVERHGSAARPGGGDRRPGQPESPDPGQTPGQTPGQDPALPGEDVPPPFSDVGAGDWYYEAVQYVYNRGMMTGAAPERFLPEGTATRAMIVTILHRLEGSPAAAPARFLDVPADQYYAGAVAWAAENGIFTGVSDTAFVPDAPITREQLAAVLWRYAAWKGLDVSRRGDLSGFPDGAQVSPYAVQAMAWAVDTGLINGVSGYLQPGGSATRAQTAVILMRLCRNVVGLS